METSSWITFNFEDDLIWIKRSQHREKSNWILLKPSDIGWTRNPFLFSSHISSHLTSQRHLPNIQASKKKVESDSLDFAQFKQPSGNPSSRGAKNSAHICSIPTMNCFPWQRSTFLELYTLLLLFLNCLMSLRSLCCGKVKFSQWKQPTLARWEAARDWWIENEIQLNTC